MAKVTSRPDFGPGRSETVDLYGVTVATANVDGHYFDFGDARPQKGCSLPEGGWSGISIISPKDGSQFHQVCSNVLRSPATVAVKTYHVHEDEGELRLQATEGTSLHQDSGCVLSPPRSK